MERGLKIVKLWKISQDNNEDYDTYDSAVVCAETAFDAQMMHPSTGDDIKPTIGFSTWVSNPSDVTCEYLGEAKEGMQKGVICASFNQG